MVVLEEMEVQRGKIDNNELDVITGSEKIRKSDQRLN